MHRAYLFDLDGTLYRGDSVLPDARGAVRELHRRGAAVRYLTNNSGQTRTAFVEKLTRMGYPVQPEWVWSSAVGAARWCGQQGVQRAFVVGEPGLVTTLREAGVSVVNALGNGVVMPQTGAEVQVVIAGICRSFDYALMNAAMQVIRSGVPFVATNRDTTYPMEGGRLVPGAGSMIAALEACGGVTPLVIGKPEPTLVFQILAEEGWRAEEVLVVGDRYDTDILCGLAAGCPTFLVTTGVDADLPEGQPGGPTLLDLIPEA